LITGALPFTDAVGAEFDARKFHRAAEARTSARHWRKEKLALSRSQWLAAKIDTAAGCKFTAMVALPIFYALCGIPVTQCACFPCYRSNMTADEPIYCEKHASIAETIRQTYSKRLALEPCAPNRKYSRAHRRFVLTAVVIVFSCHSYIDDHCDNEINTNKAVADRGRLLQNNELMHAGGYYFLTHLIPSLWG